jgi:branched-chain amino acid transport system substrate-binding protein
VTWNNLLTALLFAGIAIHAKAETGVTDTTILIGQTVGLTGTVAAPVKEMNEGNQAYIDQINKQGGVHGRKIEIRTLDDKFNPALTLINAETLIKKDRVFVLFQGRGTVHTQKILPLLEANNVPLLAPGTGASLFHQPVHPLLFNIRAKYQDEVRKAVEHFATVGMKAIGILYVDDAAGEDGLEGFTKAMEAHKLTPAAIAKFARVNPDVQTAATEVIKLQPGALIIVGSSKDTIAVIKAIREQGGYMQIMTMSNNSSDAFVKNLGPAGAGVIVTQITPAPDLMTTRLGQEFKLAAKASGTTVSYTAMEGYVNAKVLVEGLRRAGRNLTRDGFIRALESMQRVDLGGILITYSDKDHSGSEFVELTMIGKNGRFIR